MAMKDAHAEKGAHNQALIREVNERIEKLADDAAHPAFLCECADTNCVEMIELSIAGYESIRSSPVRFPIKLGHDYPEFERVLEENELSIAEYEAIRSSPVQFPVKPGHDYPQFERVVEDHEHYAVVEKVGEAARIVARLDPRSRTP